ncbi:Cache domain-containing protein [Leptothoe sp. PORK10 BA2]|nr:Cache domain-containing protein [Leptothoe sp. PORK10 BA2]MEA5466820.1 Cache domain-containing protein [Leptothoe sp. PORK10 BA2]
MKLTSANDLLTSADNLRAFQQAPDLQNFQKPSLGDAVKRRLWLNSFGGRLFWVILLSVLAGMGGMAFLFSEMLKRQAEEQVRNNIESKVNAIASVTESAETLAYSLGVSAITLNERKAQFPDTYRELVLQLFEQRPEFVIGLGLGQSENGIIEDQPWLFPYYSAVTSSEADPSDPESILYEDFADQEGEFYPATRQYKNYFLPQEKVWTAPYKSDDTRRLTYYYPLFDQNERWLGTTMVDINTAYLGQLLADKVFRKAGNFLLLTRSGQLIADPTNPMTNVENYSNIPGLPPIWNQIGQETSGFVRGETGYWAYSTVPEKDWVLLGFVPYEAIFGRIIKIAALTTGLVGLLLTLVVYLAVRKLNQRIKPILLQANQFAGQNESLMASSTQHDELEQLSLSFFNMLNQLNLHQETIRRHEETIAQSNLHADQVTERFLAFTSQIDEEARDQRALIQQVKQRLTEQIDEHESFDTRLDALLTLAQTLEGFLESIPSESESSQLFAALDQRVASLTSIFEQATPEDKAQSQALLNQLIADVTHLKAYSRQQHALEKLQHQTSDINQERQVTLAKSKAVVTAAQSITQILAEIETITSTLNRDAQQVSEMLWGELQQTELMLPGDITLPEDAQRPRFTLENTPQSLDANIFANLEKTDMEDPEIGDPDLAQLNRTIAETAQEDDLDDEQDPWV